ncbi:MAG TPA: glycoside hydrolase family 3 N-terminal domain-containing protein [Jatrophihabitans sp.]|nr:glycoside hydrolase family 3 N-terminal domain-containing protein [Jatrophihabitans sp.]
MPTATVAAAAVNPNAASAAFRAMSEAQRVGQLFMVGTPATSLSSQTVTDIQTYHVGNVILTGRSTAGVAATAAVSASLQSKANAASTAGVPLFISTDQEGGQVQVLQGTGFSSIPAALTQGGYATSTLRADAKVWGSQLKAAGVNVNLAPVLDTVPSAAFAPQNKPIGYYQREYGYDPTTVSTKGIAFAQGMADAGVDATVKHFPGLGRVTANPDVSTGVTDSQTTRTDPYLTPFANAVNAGAPFLMMSTAYYSKIDAANPAAFSPTIVTGMVRGDLGFNGVIISDSLGAAQVQAWSLGVRAINFFNAGGDMALMNDPSILPAMYNAVLQKVNTDATFKSKVDTSAMRVLTAKQNRGLLSQGMDVSSAQGNVAWQRPYNDGARFAYVKATEGTTYTNPYFAQQYNGSYNIGMIRGAYHYAHPDSSTGAAQADYFLAHGGGWSSDGRTMPPALVLQPGTSATCYGMSAATMISWIKAFSDDMHLKTSKYPMIYTTFGWWTTCTANSSAFATTNPFWLASYTSTPPASIPAGTATWTVWQSASSGLFPGGQDQFNGSYNQLLALATNPD